MAEVQTYCSHCNSSNVYLAKKGADKVGLYCGNCYKWQKWVGKKAIPSYKSRGFIIHEEGFTPGRQGNPNPNSNPNSNSNNTQYGNQQSSYGQPYQEPYQEQFTRQPMQPTAEQLYNQQQYANLEPEPESEEQGFWASELGEEVLDEPPINHNPLSNNRHTHAPQPQSQMQYQSQQPENASIHNDEQEPCPTCITRSYEPIGNSKVDISFFKDGRSHLMIVRTQAGVVGTYKASFCPSCGRPLN